MSTTADSCNSSNNTNPILRSAILASANPSSQKKPHGSFGNAMPPKNEALDLLQNWINIILTYFRQITSVITGLKYGEPPTTNYIMLLFTFSKNNVVAPLADRYHTMQQKERLAVIAFSVVFLWLPILVVLFWVIPTVLATLVVFYLIFFGLTPLKAHLEESLNEITGWTTSDIKGLTAEFKKTATDTIKSKLSEKDFSPFIKEKKQQAIATFGKLSVFAMEQLIRLISSLESLLSSQLEKVQQAKSSSNKTEKSQ